MESVNPDSSEEVRNWSELPADVMSLILTKLGAIEVLISAQSVCSSWRKISKEPQIWRSIEFRNMWDYGKNHYDPLKIAWHAVDRSCGQLEDFYMDYFVTDELLHYIADKSGRLRCLGLAYCDDVSDEGLINVVRNLPLLEELQLCHCDFSLKALEAVGHLCPLLKSFRLNCQGVKISHSQCDKEALTIAEYMPELRHLHLFGNRLSNDGLQAILDGCPHLESLDLRQCFNVNLGGDLGRRCADRIRYLRPPNDSTDDYEFDATDILEYDEYCDPFAYSDVSYDDFCDPFGYSDGSDSDSDPILFMDFVGGQPFFY